jgi:hypothetical protein
MRRDRVGWDFPWTYISGAFCCGDGAGSYQEIVDPVTGTKKKGP